MVRVFFANKIINLSLYYSKNDYNLTETDNITSAFVLIPIGSHPLYIHHYR